MVMMRRGLPCAVHRLGFAIGDSRTGTGNPNDFVSRMLVGFIRMGSMPLLRDQCFEFVTLDHVLDAVTHTAASKENLSRCFNIVSPDESRPITIEEIGPLLRGAGYPVRVLGYDAWLEEVLGMQLPDGALACMLPVLQERVMGRLTRVGDATNTARATADRPDIQFIKFTPDILLRYIEFWNRKKVFSIPLPGEPCA
ncbi:NRPS-like enzyme [Cordyceps fumosorosea ARSEF 2679]|uniref:NRPS-like enzyme n=1 Tax=Cordyceps fumosorosea (strain ARSEF 2679) TaxID=1081104 RepID=A0A162MVW7_CORFA|nr:NRPS-like enzyme [Cordyceps fumosorosea ARSEF 2679]OAA71409.1 NRPS-like enzyme [Cordyceps fumosorosea ARSEF 2679]